MSDRFELQSETFTDHDHGHEWTREVSEPLTLAAAHEYASACRAGGHADWRVPERVELETLVDLSAFNPATWPTLRDCTPSDWFWSATPYAPSSGSAWVVDFSYGYAGVTVVSCTRRVRCVR